MHKDTARDRFRGNDSIESVRKKTGNVISTLSLAVATVAHVNVKQLEKIESHMETEDISQRLDSIAQTLSTVIAE